MFPEIDAKTLKEWMKDSSVILVDVREPNEFESERIKNAFFVPLSLVSADRLPLKNKRKVVFQCRSGKRSQLACEKIEDDIDEGIELYSLEGGILAWRESGFPVLHGPEKKGIFTCKKVCVPFMKCPFSTIAHCILFISGISLLLLLALSAFASPNFVWGFIIVAVGLIVSAFVAK